jgi:hypothetical protein
VIPRLMNFICSSYLKRLYILIKGKVIIKNVLEKKEVGIAWMLAGVWKLRGIRNKTDKGRSPT